MSNPITITLTIDGDGVEAIAAAIAAKLGGDNRPPLTATTEPAPTKDKSRKGSSKGDAAAAATAAAAAEAVEAPPAEEVATTDLVTEAQKEACATTVSATSESDMRAQLTDYYTSQGSSSKDVQDALAGMSADEVTAAYTDYLARLVMDVDGKSEFTPDFDTPYKATRINDGVESTSWVKGGVTMTPEQMAEAKLPDPNAPPAPAAKGPALPKRTPAPGKKK